MYIMPKKQLTEKQYKKLLQKIKDVKKAKRKRRQNKNVNQRVSQNVIIGSNIGEKKTKNYFLYNVLLLQ